MMKRWIWAVMVIGGCCAGSGGGSAASGSGGVGGALPASDAGADVLVDGDPRDVQSGPDDGSSSVCVPSAQEPCDAGGA